MYMNHVLIVHVHTHIQYMYMYLHMYMYVYMCMYMYIYLYLPSVCLVYNIVLHKVCTNLYTVRVKKTSHKRASCSMRDSFLFNSHTTTAQSLCALLFISMSVFAAVQTGAYPFMTSAAPRLTMWCYSTVLLV